MPRESDTRPEGEAEESPKSEPEAGDGADDADGERTGEDQAAANREADPPA
jgi:hypothetical protein